ncbi:MAG: 16S rRNA (guanine(966)-N(2))-methyltransferase RsmD [Pseudohongiella sp.]|nr:16S rRNA (guanine(966)-N(2))-methyltransferase RsmD [Pseudohongiella sp.]MDO9521120.1 16S rRNA (guanine(966)-N(2))-methyltransferase RsmD [Pseudohongiella sp.]MDP2126699.1 16S rRNA (guanine(966)-N(2))-methyltransferase RsmD [Pseudohongiella sp.]
MKAKTHQQNTLRIIGGYWRGRKLRFPDVEGLRPTPDRVRETLFNWLQGLTLEEDCLDLYAGSGACGLEALSRGARHVTFVDASNLAASAIKAHLTALQCTQANVVICSAQQFLKTASADKRFGLVFMDPPFAAGLLATDCLALESSGLLKAGAYIYLESGEPLPEPGSVQIVGGAQSFPANWVLSKKGKAGAVHYGLYKREDEEPGS